MKSQRPIDKPYTIFMLGVIVGAVISSIYRYALDALDLQFVRFLAALVAIYGAVVIYRVIRDAVKLARVEMRKEPWHE